MPESINANMPDGFAELFDLSGKIALITGGAQGNGLAIAKKLAEAGAISIAADLSYGNNSIDTIQMGSINPIGIYVDVSEESSVQKCVDEIVDKYGKIDILVNNAGIIYKSYIDEISIDNWKKLLDINLTGSTICTKLASQIMKKNKWGRIVNISSTQAFLHLKTYSAYSASKVALSHLTKIWAEELVPYNITVNALCPGYVLTPMMENTIAKRQKENKITRDEAIAEFAEHIPQKRILDPEEIGNWALILCSKLSDSLTGTNISISGGWVMH